MTADHAPECLDPEPLPLAPRVNPGRSGLWHVVTDPYTQQQQQQALDHVTQARHTRMLHQHHQVHEGGQCMHACMQAFPFAKHDRVTTSYAIQLVDSHFSFVPHTAHLPLAGPRFRAMRLMLKFKGRQMHGPYVGIGGRVDHE